MSFGGTEWKPTPKQELFLSLPWSIFEAAYGGGNGSGKSDILLVYGVSRRLHENPKFKQVFQRRTYMELKNEIVPRSRELYTKFGATFNKTDMAWTFPRPDEYGGSGARTGAMIFLAHCEHEDDVHKFDSMEINLYTPDELTSFTEYIYIYIGFTRVRTNDPLRMVNGQLMGLPAAIRTAGMPGGIGHTFFKKRFVTPYPQGGRIIIGKGGIKRFYVHATVADNKHADPEYTGRLDAIPNEAERKARKFGDWDAYAGQVFDEFRDRHYPDEPENALHVIEPFDIPEWWPKMIIGDWGYAAMTYIGFYAISPSKRIYLYRELYWLKTKIEEWAPIIKDFSDRETPRIIKFCKSAGQDRGQEHTIQEQISTALGRDIELSNNSPGSRVAGKMMLHEYLRWKPRPVIPVSEMPIYSEEKAMFILRNKGLIEYKSYLSLFDPPEEETNIPKLQIFKCKEDGDHEGHPFCCPIMIDTIKACAYAKNTSDGKPAEDVAEFPGDDPYDDLRYAVDSAEAYFNEAQDEFQRVVKQQELLARLAQNNNMTAFYIAMRKNEEAAKQTMVRRYHRGRH